MWQRFMNGAAHAAQVGLARRFINGPSSSTLGLQALSASLAFSQMGEAYHTSKIFLFLWWLGLAEGGGLDVILQAPRGQNPQPTFPHLGCLSAHWREASRW